MAQDLFLPVETTVTQTENVGVTLKELFIARGDSANPGALVVTLAALDEAGKWRSDVAPVRVRKEDDPTKEDPREKFAASIFQQLIFTAIVPQTPQNVAMGIAGLAVWDAAKVILGQELSNP